MISILKSLLLTAILIAVSGCGSESSGPKSQLQTLNGVEYLPLEGAVLKSGDSLIEGSGKILFRKPLTDEDNNFDLSFKLGQSGSLCLIALSDDSLKTGLNVCFATAQNGALQVTLKDGNSPANDISDKFAATSSGDLSVSMDVHGHGHLVFWLNGGEEVELPFMSRPTGTLWGLSLSDAAVKSAVQGPAKEAH
ncbi:hypothetical protein K2X33_14765 [bacterium]|nr:hypothetical protein [bacterium]